MEKSKMLQDVAQATSTQVAFEERLKIHDVVLEGVDLALRRRGYASVEGRKVCKKR